MFQIHNVDPCVGTAAVSSERVRVVLQCAAAMLQIQDKVPSGIQDIDVGEASAGGGMLRGVRARRGGPAVRARVHRCLRPRQVRCAQYMRLRPWLRRTRMRYM